MNRAPANRLETQWDQKITSTSNWIECDRFRHWIGPNCTIDHRNKGSMGHFIGLLNNRGGAAAGICYRTDRHSGHASHLPTTTTHPKLMDTFRLWTAQVDTIIACYPPLMRDSCLVVRHDWIELKHCKTDGGNCDYWPWTLFNNKENRQSIEIVNCNCLQLTIQIK